MTSHAAHWTDRAACADRLDLPWTRDAADVTPWQAATMRAICSTCPALFDCLAAVDALDVTGGWWAGHDRDPNADLSHLAPPDWATDDTDSGPVSAGLSWLPIRSRRTGDVLGEQLALNIA